MYICKFNLCVEFVIVFHYIFVFDFYPLPLFGFDFYSLPLVLLIFTDGNVDLELSCYIFVMLTNKVLKN